MKRKATRTRWQRVDGIVLLDKPAGMSSNAALQSVRRLYAAEKGGHTGSLDPLATGMLPLCFGEATKIAGLLLGARKAYETVARLGIVTDTLDADGEVLSERPIPDLDEAIVQAQLDRFTGRISQMPPIYSALKLGGLPAYQRVRAGETVDLRPREVDIHAIQLLGLGSGTIRLRVECGSGTYIRSLVRDLGEVLGCGAHVEELRRLWVEPFQSRPMVTLDELEALDVAGLAEHLQPIEAGLRHLPSLKFDLVEMERLRKGQRLPTAAGDGEYIAWCEALAIGRVSVADGVAKPERQFHPAAPFPA